MFKNIIGKKVFNNIHIFTNYIIFVKLVFAKYRNLKQFLPGVLHKTLLDNGIKIREVLQREF